MHQVANEQMVQIFQGFDFSLDSFPGYETCLVIVELVFGRDILHFQSKLATTWVLIREIRSNQPNFPKLTFAQYLDKVEILLCWSVLSSRLAQGFLLLKEWRRLEILSLRLS
mmetsp:Transcript_5585/g.16168  ORF Transcript_5585/g.16168 Transcript_5585/m.16168 type:complete len:112 (+) Transcript_5585:91-426(+)